MIGEEVERTKDKQSQKVQTEGRKTTEIHKIIRGKK